jgi:hypothetical protein
MSHPKFVDKSGNRYGRLLVLRRVLPNHKGRARWACLCDCGTERVILSCSLGTRTVSCGCLIKEATVASNKANKTKHGHTAGGKVSREWNSWKSMRERCYVSSNIDFHNYGGCGVVVCDRWLGDKGFENFIADMGPRPKGTSLDRYPNPKGNYQPGNCRWATPKQQNRNKRGTVTVMLSGIKTPLAEACEKTGIGYSTALGRLHEGRDWRSGI